MANKRVSELQDASLPLQRTDKILVSRDGYRLTKANASDLPLPLTTQQAANPDITGVVASTESGDAALPNGQLLYLANAVTPKTNDSDGIDAAIAYLVATGKPGTVLYRAEDYTITRSIPPISNISHIGVPPKITFSGDIPDTQFIASGGTRFLVADGVTAFRFNNVDQVSVADNLATTGCSNITLRGFSFVGGAAHIDTGAYLALGMLYSRFEELYSFNSTDFGFNFENFQHCTFRNLYQSTVLTTGGGGIRFACSLDSTLLPGNSTIDGEIYTYCVDRKARSIVFECTGPAGCQMNQVLVAGRLQGNRYGAASTLAISGAFTNGSPNIVVADATQYDHCRIGMPLVFTGSTPSGFTQNVVYWVASRNDGTNTITLAANPLSTSAINSGSTGSFSATCGGFPSLEIHANSTSTFTNCDFGYLDLENFFGITSLSIRRTRTCVAELSENFASQARNALVFRDAGIAIEANNVSNITTDVDSSSNISINYTLGGVRALSAGETLVNARANCELQLSNASAQNITVNSGLMWGFKTNLFQAGAGQVTFVPGSGVTINGRNGLKTAGQYARVTLTQTARDVYVLSGDTAV